MTQIAPFMPHHSPFALTSEELDCLQRLRRGETAAHISCSTRWHLLSNGCLEVLGSSLTLTPRGRTALLCGRI